MSNDNHKNANDQMMMIWEYDYWLMKWVMFGTGIFCGIVSSGVAYMMYNLWLNSN